MSSNCEEYRDETGRLHRVDGPSRRIWDGTGDAKYIMLEDWHLDGQLHRVDGPARQELTKWSLRHSWYLRGSVHRDDGPAVQYWSIHQNEKLLTEELWYRNGHLYRVDGPAYQQWDVFVADTPQLICEIWVDSAGEYHRDDGPAYRVWSSVNASMTEQYFTHGRKI